MRKYTGTANVVSIFRTKKFQRLLILVVVVVVVVAYQVAQLDRIKILRAKLTKTISTKVESFVTENFRDKEKLVSITSLIRDREDTMKWDQEVAQRILLIGPIDNIKGHSP